MGYASQGGAPLFGIGAPAFTLYEPGGGSASGYIMPTVNGFTLTHNVGESQTKDESGDIDAVTFHGEFIECAFTLLPTGSSSADALASARIPAPGSTITITGAAVQACGSFADAINVASSGSLPATARWIYGGGGSVQRSSDGHAVLNLTLRRYPKIVGGIAITS